jgi:DNA-binding beta-propeller fold protein YncE
VSAKPGTRLLIQATAQGAAIVDIGNHRIVVLTHAQSVLQFGGHTSNDNSSACRAPWGVAIDTSGQFFVSDTNNHRVQVLDANGVFL